MLGLRLAEPRWSSRGEGALNGFHQKKAPRKLFLFLIAQIILFSRNLLFFRFSEVSCPTQMEVKAADQEEPNGRCLRRQAPLRRGARSAHHDLRQLESVVFDATRDIQWNTSTIYKNQGRVGGQQQQQISATSVGLPPPGSDPEWDQWVKKEWTRFNAIRTLRHARKAALQHSARSVREQVYPLQGSFVRSLLSSSSLKALLWLTTEESKATRELLEYQRHAYERLSSHLDKLLHATEENAAAAPPTGGEGEGERVGQLWDEDGLSLFKLLFGREAVVLQPSPSSLPRGSRGHGTSSSDSDSEEEAERMKMLQQAVTEVKPTQWNHYGDSLNQKKEEIDGKIEQTTAGDKEANEEQENGKQEEGEQKQASKKRKRKEEKNTKEKKKKKKKEIKAENEEGTKKKKKKKRKKETGS